MSPTSSYWSSPFEAKSEIRHEKSQKNKYKFIQHLIIVTL